jgi:hypothetical protein
MATYDPSKNYTWNPDTKFVISGQDLGLILNTLRGILATQEATNAIMAYEANKRVETLVAKSVEDGSIFEVKPKEETIPPEVLAAMMGAAPAQEPVKVQTQNTKTLKKVR